jgi:glucosamine--fructose-6-phosphate aminotransferase (isomerizing)
VLRYEKTVQLMRDMQAQGAEIIALASEGDPDVPNLAHFTISIPDASEYLLTILEVVPLQMLAYFTAILRGIDVDSPRNLVKAVVQE